MLQIVVLQMIAENEVAVQIADGGALGEPVYPAEK
jgi:hypothetical protein